jgi:hypothetical protein
MINLTSIKQKVERINNSFHPGRTLHHLLTRLSSEDGAETVEWLGLAAVVVVLIGAVALYISGAGQGIIDALRDLINSMIAGFAQGW